MHLRSALSLLETSAQPDERLRSELMLALARAELLCGSLDTATELRLRAAAHARAIGSSVQLVSAALDLSSSLDGRVHRMDWSTLGPILREAIDVSDPERPAVRARLLARLAQTLELAGDPARADRALDDARRAAQRAEDRAALSDVLCAEHLLLIGTPRTERRLDISREMVRHARDTGNLEQELMFLGYGMYEHLVHGRLDDWERERVVFADRARVLNGPEGLSSASKMLAMRALMRGELDGVQAHVALASRATTLGDVRLAEDLKGQLMALQYYQADIDLAALRAIAASGAWPSPLWFAPVYRSLGARSDVARVLELDAARIVPSRHLDWLPWAVFLADAVAFVGDVTRARTLLGWLGPYADQHAVMGGCLFYQGPVARYLGLLHGALGRWDDAISSLERALHGATGVGAQPWQCQIHFDLSEAYRCRAARGDSSQARCHARQAAKLADRVPVRPVQRQLAARGD